MTGNHILIIEDNLLNLELATDLLEAGGFVVSSAQTAEEGLRMARELLPDLVLMDFSLPIIPKRKNATHRDAIILACASKQYFAEVLREGGAYPLLWTTNLMAPEAYTLKSALDGWIGGENSEQIQDRAAGAYDKYQKCGLRAAHRLFATGW